MTASLSAIIAEAQSTDPWTSRARPSFMYVIYVLILAGIPIGILAAFRPDIANNIASGLNLWLRAIPDSLYTLFGVGYLGYTGARTIEKSKGVA
jgi:phosphotransferase system  glucose/maltose/N-acetylglucosamine-specific IIC component